MIDDERLYLQIRAAGSVRDDALAELREILLRLCRLTFVAGHTAKYPGSTVANRLAVDMTANRQAVDGYQWFANYAAACSHDPIAGVAADEGM